MRLNNPLKRYGVFFGIKLIRFVTLSLLVLMLLSIMEACAPSVNPDTGQLNDSNAKTEIVDGEINPEITPDQSAVKKTNECAGLDSLLLQLTEADDPLPLAEQLGIEVKDGTVQVLILLNSEDTEFLKEYSVVVGTQSGNQVQAYVLIDRLCELVNNESVLAIRLAAQVNP